MRLARILTAGGPVAVTEAAGEWHGVEDLFATPLVLTGERWPIEGTALAAPVEPRVVLGMAHNGSAADRALPPQAFHKSARTVVGPGDDIVLDQGIGTVNVEGELAVVIGRPARHLTAENALQHVLGYTIGNDVTAADQVPLDDKMLQSKNGDGYTPIGPWIETELDPDALGITVSVAGAVVKRSSTDRLAWNIAEQLVYITSNLTLGPGDVILTGSPDTFAPALPGDLVELAIDGIGELRNPVVAGRPRAALPSP